MNVSQTSLFKEFQALKEEVNRHKWIESEKVGYDIGFTKALIDWTMKHKSQWLAERKKERRKKA